MSSPPDQAVEDLREAARPRRRLWPRDPYSYIRNLYRARHRPRWATVAVLSFAVIFVILLMADGLYTVFSLRTSLEGMAGSLDRGANALSEGDLVAAEGSFDAAMDEAQDALELTPRPGLVIASYIPFLSDDARVLRGLPQIGLVTAKGGRSAVQAATALGATSRDRLAESLYRNGRLQFATIRRAEGLIAETEEIFGGASVLLEALPDPQIPRLASAVATAEFRIQEARDVLTRVTSLFDVLPDMLGGNGTRRYLAAFVSNSEARPSGGLIGLYGIVETRNGRSRLVTVAPFDLPAGVSAVDAGLISQKEARQVPELGAEGISEASLNSSPLFADVARNLLALYEEKTGEKLDGVLQVDPVALGYFTRATGPLKATGLAQLVTPDNAARLILRDAYVEFSDRPVAQTRFLLSIIRGFWDRLAEGKIDAPAMVEAFGTAGRSEHLKIYSTDPDEQEALALFGMDGSFVREGPNLQLVYHQNLSGNKVDYFLRREFNTEIVVASDGYALVETTAALHNNAPEKLPEGLVASSDRNDWGANRMRLSFLLPERADVTLVKVDGRRASAVRSEREGFPVASVDIEIPPSETATVTISYNIEGAVDLLRGGDLRLNLFPQPVTSPDRFKVTVIPPLGYRATTEARHRTEPNNAVSVSGRLETPRHLHMRLVPL